MKVERLPPAPCMVAGHWLFPHERWFAVRFLRARLAGNSAQDRRSMANYGPDGVLLMGAAYAAIGLGGGTAIVGIALLVGSGGRGALVSVGNYLLAAGFCIDVIGAIVRGAQFTRAGRRFRGPMPYLKKAR